jgi:hypothetical protein
LIRTTRLSHACQAIAILAAIAGCADSPDQRLAGFAKDAMATQTKQNQQIADQATAVVQESHQLAKAAGDLVEHDANARHDLILAYRDLTTQINAHKSLVDAGREQLDSDRRELARQQLRDPIIAATIHGVGLILASLLPLGVAAYVIHLMIRQEPDHAAVSELLITDLASDKPLIWPGLQKQLAQPDQTREAHQPEASWDYGEEADDPDDMH